MSRAYVQAARARIFFVSTRYFRTMRYILPDGWCGQAEMGTFGSGLARLLQNPVNRMMMRCVLPADTD